MFLPKDGHTLIDIDETQAVVSQENADEDTIAAWIEKPSSKSLQLQVIICAERFDQGLEHVPFPLSGSTWDTLSSAFNIPPGFLDLISSQASMPTEYSLSDNSPGFLTALGSKGITITHNMRTKQTRCFVIGFCLHERLRFRTELCKLAKYVSDPILPLLLWLEICTEIRLRRCMYRKLKLEHIQVDTGMHFTVPEARLHDVSRNMDKLVHKLTVVWHDLAWDEYALKTLIEAHGRASGAFSSHFEKPNALGILAQRTMVGMRMINVRDLLSSLQRRTATSVQHSHIQLQTIYNFVNQRDSQVNIAHAAASRQLAELSLHDSSVMRSIALDSNKVALLTRRDSTDMRIIAAVTLGFLPPTFVATLFSTSFFNFQPPESSDRVVSQWIWLYASLAVALTALVMAAWYIFSRRSRRKTTRELTVFTPGNGGALPLPHTTVLEGTNISMPTTRVVDNGRVVGNEKVGSRDLDGERCATCAWSLT
ncbi:hypothetical protein CC80DRAFT_541444 [Byssothecium circinans]|uniref:Cora-domain-containing protein n=1 Tax=Byssothecium circinans TaxID=147558 RepID=A0A6A5UIA0_9PLEO|nr:hypothetical protein CC80DRAFT_541444 [Byssothecium circinans]